MGLSGIGPQGPNQNSPNQGIGKSSSIQLSVAGQVIQVSSASILDAASSMAKVAYELGHTNNEDEFAEDIAEDIEAALKIVAKRKNKKKK